MPFDSKDFVETKPDVFSLEGLIAWLKTQDPATTYLYSNPRLCLMGMYTADRGGRYDASLAEYIVGACRLDAEPSGLGVFYRVVTGEPRTYGAALERARKLLASS